MVFGVTLMAMMVLPLLVRFLNHLGMLAMAAQSMVTKLTMIMMFCTLHLLAMMLSQEQMALNGMQRASQSLKRLFRLKVTASLPRLVAVVEVLLLPRQHRRSQPQPQQLHQHLEVVIPALLTQSVPLEATSI